MSEQVISVVIPTTSLAKRDLDPLSKDITGQTVAVREVVTVQDVSPSGRARNEGARQTSGDILVFLDDDIRLGHDRVFAEMIRVLHSHTGIGMVGASQLLPPDSSGFQQRAARQLPRMVSPVVSVPTDSDMVTTACCAVRRDLFWEIGGFNEQLPRGVDPEFRHRLRSRGLRTVVAPQIWFYHPMPPTLAHLLRTFFRNGRMSAETYEKAPWAAFENPDGHVSRFVERRSVPFRVARHLGRVVAGIATVQWIGVAARMAYTAGYLWPRSSDGSPEGRLRAS